MNKLGLVLILLFVVVALDMGRTALVSMGVLGAPSDPTAPVPELSPTPLFEAREGFQTRPVKHSYQSRGDAPVAPREQFSTVRYFSPAGELIAYCSPDPRNGQRRPALVWAHEGFGGIGDEFFAPNHPIQRFVKAGMVVFIPSWRGENDNPGDFELFLGEVKDAVAAVNYVSLLPHVDPKRIYMLGQGSAGTLTMLAALATDKLRAAFAIGGTPDLARIMAPGKDYGNTPFLPLLSQEVFLRSPIHFARHLQTPTFFFAGWDDPTAPDARRMALLTQKAPARFTPALLKGADHESLKGPMLAFLARKILLDRDQSPIQFTPEEVQIEFDLQRKK